MSHPRIYTTLLSRTSYLAGTLVLHRSLQSTSPKYPLVVLITSTLPQEARDVLTREGIQMKEVELVLLPEDRYDYGKTEARFRDIWTKIRVFELEEYERIVFLDSDMVVRRNMDDIFDTPITPNQVAAVSVCACNPKKIAHYPKDWTPANCAYSRPNYPACLSEPPDPSQKVPRPYYLLNSGMFLCRPSKELFGRMTKMLDSSPLVPEWKFCDQDLIGTFFGGGGVEDEKDWGTVKREELGDMWYPVPYYYNALKTLRQVHTSFWSDSEIRVVHYILPDKPWLDRPPPNPDPSSPSYEQQVQENSLYEESKRWWWSVYDVLIADMLEDEERKKGVELVESVCGPKKS